MSAESAYAHVQRCKEEVEVLKEPFGVAGVKVGCLHELLAHRLCGNANKLFSLCQLGDCGTEVLERLGCSIGDS